jgi:2-alkyl-3-oxoalkanoate reductase
VDVFVTGGTRVLGRPVLALLRERGHRVRALSRRSSSDAEVRALAAEPVRADLFSPGELRAAVAGADAVLHLATRIPTGDAAARPEAWAENDRIRAEGTRNLVDAALAAGTAVVVYPGVVFVYPDRGAEWVDALCSVDAGSLGSTLVAEREVARFAAGGGRGVSLRMGWFYGPTASTPDLVAAARSSGVAGLRGPAGAYLSLVWVDDAAAAVVAAMERAPTGVYDVVDDEPLTRGELTAELARAAGVPSLRREPDGSGPLSRSQRVSNRRFREATGWAPSVRDAREGLRRLSAASAR